LHQYFVLKQNRFISKKITSEKGYKEFVEKFPDFEEFLENTDLEYDLDEVMIPIKPKHEKTFFGAMKYIEHRYKSLVANGDPNGQEIKCFPTCSIEKDQIKTIFEIMKDKIFVLSATGSGLKF